jgi:hypothetical protein
MEKLITSNDKGGIYFGRYQPICPKTARKTEEGRTKQKTKQKKPR